MAIGGIMPLRDDPHREVLAAGLEAGETVGAHGAEHHGDEGADARQHQAVPDGEGIAVLEQHAIIGELNALGLPDGRVMEDLLRRLEGDDEQPIDREDEEQGERDRGGIAQRKARTGRRRVIAQTPCAGWPRSRRATSERRSGRRSRRCSSTRTAEIPGRRYRWRWSRSWCPGRPRSGPR